MTVHLIAEAGNNHNGDPETAIGLIDVANRAGADSVKFQVINPEQLYLSELPVPGGYEPNEVVEARRRHQLADDDYRRLAEHCAEIGISFSASIFDEDGIRLLDELDASYLKIASCDLDNIRLIRRAATTGRRVVLSTGMASLEEVERSVAAFAAEGNEQLVLLHCVSVYPATLEQMNLGFLDQLAAFGYEIGLSDHTGGSTASAMALARGATWLEKHFTLDRNQTGFDHAYALEPSELESYVEEVRAAAGAMRAPAEKVGSDEAAVAERARRSIYAARDLEAGRVLGEDDLLVVRPSGPLPAAAADGLLGARLTEPLRRFEPFREELLER